MSLRMLRPWLVLIAPLLASQCALGEPDDSVTLNPTGVSQTMSASNTSLSTTSGSTTGFMTFATSTEEPTTGPTTVPPTTEPPTTNGPTTTDPTNYGGTDGTCEGGCAAPPGLCFQNPGECVDGMCWYEPLEPGTACDDGDPCTADDACDEDLNCVGGDPVDCSPPPNAEGGTCVNGACEGFTCVAPYENCDGDWENGCEVPTGVANQCDINGLTPDGCWTAYCGSLENDPDAINFGTFYCYDCSTCHSPINGQVQWCNHSNGQWYPLEAGACGMWEDLVCSP